MERDQHLFPYLVLPPSVLKEISTEALHELEEPLVFAFQTRARREVATEVLERYLSLHVWIPIFVEHFLARCHEHEQWIQEKIVTPGEYHFTVDDAAMLLDRADMIATDKKKKKRLRELDTHARLSDLGMASLRGGIKNEPIVYETCEYKPRFYECDKEEL